MLLSYYHVIIIFHHLMLIVRSLNISNRGLNGTSTCIQLLIHVLDVTVTIPCSYWFITVSNKPAWNWEFIFLYSNLENINRAKSVTTNSLFLLYASVWNLLHYTRYIWWSHVGQEKILAIVENPKQVLCLGLSDICLWRQSCIILELKFLSGITGVEWELILDSLWFNQHNLGRFWT